MTELMLPEIEEQPIKQLVAVPVQAKTRILIRRARLADLPQLEDLMVDFYETQRRRGSKTLARDPAVLRGGVVVELSMNFTNVNCQILVADKDRIIIGFFIAELVHCRPIEEYHRAVWIKGDYLPGKSLANPLILKKMWEEIYSWGVQNGASYFYGDIHQGNQPSIKTAKAAGFRHNMTRFLRLTDNGG